MKTKEAKMSKDELDDFLFKKHIEREMKRGIEFHFFSENKKSWYVLNEKINCICSWQLFRLTIWRLRYQFAEDVQLKCIKTYIVDRHITIECPEGNDKISILVDGFWRVNAQTAFEILSLVAEAYS